MTSTEDELPLQEWLAIRKAAALKIDPHTATVRWQYARTMDPYGLDPGLPEELQQIGREYFARSPPDDIWVSFRDIPAETVKAIRARATTAANDEIFEWEE